jgi:hypothetical protein
MDEVTSRRQICLHYERALIGLGECATSADVDGWLENLRALIAEEFDAEVTLCRGTWETRSTCCHDRDVDERLQMIAASDEWADLLP